MIPLRDRVTVKGKDGGAAVETIPAYVGFAKGGDAAGAAGQRYNREDLVAIVEPGTVYDELQHVIVHKGTEYRPNGAPANHYQHGVLHHVTIPLKRTTYT